ncbi:hypothetical protein ANO14919_030490 [Xylariales sp. No.14919]|nr:hypothetical protein ANO14919_030490 [Xylariales sp. No.14919]
MNLARNQAYNSCVGEGLGTEKTAPNKIETEYASEAAFCGPRTRLPVCFRLAVVTVSIYPASSPGMPVVSARAVHLKRPKSDKSAKGQGAEGSHRIVGSRFRLRLRGL